MKRKDILNLAGYSAKENGDYVKGNRFIKSKTIRSPANDVFKFSFSVEDKHEFIKNCLELGLLYKDIENAFLKHLGNQRKFDVIFKEEFDKQKNLPK